MSRNIKKICQYVIHTPLNTPSEDEKLKTDVERFALDWIPQYSRGFMHEMTEDDIQTTIDLTFKTLQEQALKVNMESLMTTTLMWSESLLEEWKKEEIK